MKSIYFQLVGGAAGDMLLYSLIGLGCPLPYLKKELKKLKLNFDLRLSNLKAAHTSTKVLDFKGQSGLSYKKIENLIRASKLDKEIKEKALKAYETLFNIERKIHNAKEKDFTFHHLGEIDAILEICGFYIALKYLKINNVCVSSFPLSNPCQATLEILKGKKVNIGDFGYETVTPTAAVLLKEAEQSDLSFDFERCSMSYGKCGEKDYLVAYLIDTLDTPAFRSGINADRLSRRSHGKFPQEIYRVYSEGGIIEKPRGLVQEGSSDIECGIEKDKIIKMETNIDDMNPQMFEHVFEKLYANGAKEAYIEQVVMKKTRPAFVLNVLCAFSDFERIRNVIFSCTTTFGIRYNEYSRDKLKHDFVLKKTKFGKIKFRVSGAPFKKETPEYEDCLIASKKLNIPLIEIYKHL